MGNYIFWTHGVNVQVLDRNRLTEISRHGYGTRVKQKWGTDNWFHFAIPTPSQFDDESNVSAMAFFINAVCSDAGIRDVHVYDGKDCIIEHHVPGLQGDDNVNYSFNFKKGKKITSGLEVSLRVYFAEGAVPKEPIGFGEVTFRSVGVRFNVWEKKTGTLTTDFKPIDK